MMGTWTKAKAEKMDWAGHISKAQPSDFADRLDVGWVKDICIIV